MGETCYTKFINSQSIPKDNNIPSFLAKQQDQGSRIHIIKILCIKTEEMIIKDIYTTSQTSRCKYESRLHQNTNNT